uniref:MIF4G domain-containing protein n=1 Tax=Ascaris lumbricoides TaxID=6252 RepID=A0A0M3IVY9_ASCLU
MTIDVDYELNWNKENIPIGGSLKKKAATFERNPSKRNILGELHEIIGEESSPKRGRNQSQSNIASIDENDMEMEKQKWAKIALTLRCDKENNEEQLMEELLNLCSWYNDHEESTGKIIFFFCGILCKSKPKPVY